VQRGLLKLLFHLMHLFEEALVLRVFILRHVVRHCALVLWCSGCDKTDEGSIGVGSVLLRISGRGIEEKAKIYGMKVEEAGSADVSRADQPRRP
jgi:hypothetical protein